MIQIYHNPRCSKSRSALELLEEKNVEFEVVKYIDEALTPDELSGILEKLNMDAIDLIRKNEALWKSEFADKEMDDEELVLLMIEYPKLMERPIVVNGNKAAIGRPTENILEII